MKKYASAGQEQELDRGSARKRRSPVTILGSWQAVHASMPAGGADVGSMAADGWRRKGGELGRGVVFHEPARILNHECNPLSAMRQTPCLCALSALQEAAWWALPARSLARHPLLIYDRIARHPHRPELSKVSGEGAGEGKDEGVGACAWVRVSVCERAWGLKPGYRLCPRV